jgi:hypothetical protein
MNQEAPMSFVRLELETNLNTSENMRQPGVAYHFHLGTAIERWIGLDTKFSVLQRDDKKDPALAFLRASAKDGFLSISISTQESVDDDSRKRRGDITFQISKGKEYHIIHAYVPKEDFHFIAAIVAASKRRTYVSSIRPVGEMVEWLLPFLRTEKRFSLKLDFYYDSKALEEWVNSTDDEGTFGRQIDITNFSFGF